MKHLLLFSFLCVCAALGDENGFTPSEQVRLKQSAMAMMEDVVPHEPVANDRNAMVRIYGDRGRAVLGRFFGDDQIGALVAVKSEKADDAVLCLLLWQTGWKFAEMAGRVSGTDISNQEPTSWNWALERSTLAASYYVVSGLDPNLIGYQEHPSWLCDPKTHSLKPTGWPKDAIPSLCGNTITFQRRGTPGYPPIIFEIDEFDGNPGKNLAVYAEEQVAEGQLITVHMLDSAQGQRVTWRILTPTGKSNVLHDQSSICYSSIEGKLEPFHEDATMDIQWGEQTYHQTTNFLIWRLTGIEANAQRGSWGQEDERWTNLQNPPPVRIVVLGIPEAVKAFSWPLNPGMPTPGTPVPEPK